MKEEFDVKDALSIDKFALDYESGRQAHLVNDVTDLLADVSYKRDRAKAKHSYESAKLANWIRSNPDDYGIIGTATDSKVKEIVVCDDHIRDLERVYHEWEAEVISVNGVRRALEHKKGNIEEHVRLFLSGYWATPYVSREDKEAVKTASDNTQTDALKTNERLMRRSNNGKK